MDLEKLKSDQREKIESNNVEIEKLNSSKVMLRLTELQDDNLKRIEELQFLEQLERIPNIDAMLEKVRRENPVPGSENIGKEKPPKTTDERI